MFGLIYIYIIKLPFNSLSGKSKYASSNKIGREKSLLFKGPTTCPMMDTDQG